ncbi:MAG: radical SAM protein, partial [Desulfovermiculus sp.]
MQVLLVSANCVHTPYPVYPLGLDYVAGSIGKQHHVQVKDISQLGGIEALAAEMGKQRPDVVGISLRNIDNTDVSRPEAFIQFYRDVVSAVREKTEALIVLGGSGFTIFPQELMRYLEADFGIVGEGERFGLFLDALEKAGNPLDIPGVLGPASQEYIPPPWPGNMHRDFNQDASHVRFYLHQGGILNVQTKRGCPFRCIYCTYPHIEGRSLRRISPQEVAATAVRLQEGGAKFLFITDSAFNADYEHSAEVGQAFQEAGLSIPWGAFFAPTTPPPGYFENLAAAGLTHVEFGTDSLADAVLEAYRKPYRTASVFQAHAAAAEAGLYIAHYFLLGGPGETRTTLEQTLEAVDKLSQAVHFFFCG